LKRKWRLNVLSQVLFVRFNTISRHYPASLFVHLIVFPAFYFLARVTRASRRRRPLALAKEIGR
jgi:hypothetical protein